MAQLKGPNKTLKYFVVVINGIFVIFGIVLIAVGAWTETHIGPYVEISMFNYMAGNRVLIFVGCVITIVALLGAFGALIESRRLMIIFFVLLLVLTILELAGTVVAYENRDKIKRNIRNEVAESIKHFPGKNEKAVNDMQVMLKCCGAQTGPEDWTMNEKMRKEGSVPKSCCKPDYDTSECGKGELTTKSNKIFKEACLPILEQLISDKIRVIAALGITMLVIQLIGMVFALILIFKVDEPQCA